MKEQNEEQLEKLLVNLAKEAQPDKKFELMLQQKLKERFAEEHKTGTSQASYASSFFMRLLKFKLQFATAFVLVLFTSTTIYAYESDAVTNGHILYPLKRTAEKVEGIFANSPEEKSAYYHKMAKRRISELETLEEKGSSDEETIVEAETMLTYAEAELENIPEEVEENVDLPEVQPTFSDGQNPETTEMATPQIIAEKQFKTKRELKKEELLKTREEFQGFRKKFEKKIEDKDGKLKNKDNKEILENKFNKKQNKKIDETAPEIKNSKKTDVYPNPEILQPTFPKPVSGPNSKPPKPPKIEYGETSVIEILPPPPLKPFINPKKEKPELFDPMIPTI